MAKQVQRRYGTTANHSAFTGALAEITIDTDKDVPVVHDGAQVGGFPALRADLANLQSAIGGFRNAVINGAFNVNQYPAFAPVGSGGAYVLDRWWIQTPTSTVTASLSAAGITLTKNTGANVVNLRHRIEAANSRIGVGQRRKLSFIASSSAAVNLTATVSSANAADNFTGVTSRASSATLMTGTATRIELVIPTNAAFANGTEINFSMSLPIGGTVTIDQVQLEPIAATGPGPATPFERRPYSAELAMCERYYEIGGVSTSIPALLYSGQTTGGSQYRAGCNFRTTKRVAPTVFLTGIAAPNGFSTTPGTPSNVTVTGFNEPRNATSTVTAGFFGSSFTASAEL